MSMDKIWRRQRRTESKIVTASNQENSTIIFTITTDESTLNPI
jgi:hypothetical protein